MRSRREESHSYLSRILPALLATLFVLWSGSAALLRAETLPEPQGKVILTVSGNLSNHNGQGIVRLDRQMLMDIGLHELSTRSYSLGEPSLWRGVLMRDLLAFVGARGKEIEAISLDKYRKKIPRVDFETYDVILALEKNGKPLSIRTRGPTRIIYPYDQHEELQSQAYGGRLVWQIKKIVVK